MKSLAQAYGKMPAVMNNDSFIYKIQSVTVELKLRI